jgi:hypothetical protein
MKQAAPEKIPAHKLPGFHHTSEVDRGKLDEREFAGLSNPGEKFKADSSMQIFPPDG